MKKNLLLSFPLLLFGYDYANSSISYSALLHFESQKVFKKELQVSKLLTLETKEEEQNFANFYNELSYRYETDTSLFAFNTQLRYNTTLFHDEYKQPIYLERFALEDINTAFISMASVDINTQYLSVTLGRNLVDMPWLQGSIDSAMVYSENSYFSLRAFYFLNYYDFAMNYFVAEENLEGMFGLYVESQPIKNVDIDGYYYKVVNEGTLVGTTLHVGSDIELHGSYTLYNSDVKDVKETFIRAWLNFSKEDVSMELGGSLTSEVGLLYMLRFGSHPFSPFYLNNEIQRSSAQNYYGKLSYDNRYFYTDILAGSTRYYDDAIVNRTRQKVWLNAFEYDIYVGRMFNEYVGMELSYMNKDLSKEDIYGFDQSLVMATLLVSWQ